VTDAYAEAGVSIESADKAVELMKVWIDKARRPEVIGGIGGFAGLFDASALTSYRRPLLATSTDGVGTKVAIAQAMDVHDTIGFDLVGMVVDDLVVCGAQPLFMTDYIACGRVVPERIAAIVKGIAEACVTAGCALVGGETAEHPGLMDDDTFDLSGCCIGVVERADVLDGSTVEAGDAIIGLQASGLHSNGFSLIRALLAQWDLDLGEPYQARMLRTLGEAESEAFVTAAPQEAMATLGEVLLTPTRVYAPAVLAARAAVRAIGLDLHGIAHITGGGLPGNVPRGLAEGLAARMDPTRWAMPSVMHLFGALGGMDDAELRATFNGGLGMTLTLPLAAVAAALRALEAHGVGAAVVGEVILAGEGDGANYIEGPLEGVA
jgi:phosphoribosylformylglycinamidine cyclo-ligase